MAGAAPQGGDVVVVVLEVVVVVVVGGVVVGVVVVATGPVVVVDGAGNWAPGTAGGGIGKLHMAAAQSVGVVAITT